jgi:hypothetical protein
MVIENILNNNEYKLFFLKAILLGIDYGSNDNAEFYKTNIKNEISKIIIDKKEEIKYKSNIPKEENKYKLNIPKEEFILNINKQENIILNLEYQQRYYINLINKLSFNNYSFNYSKINILKHNLFLINQELEKNKLKLKKYKQINNIEEPKENLVNELEKTLGNLSNLFIN